MTTPIETHMRAVRLHAAGDPASLALEQAPVPRPGPGEVLVRVHAAAITRDELDWPTDRLPATPSYELSGVVEATGEEVFALTPFDRDGVASDYAVVPEELLAPKPRTLGHVQSAAIPLPGLSAWQGLFDHGKLQPGQRVLVHGAAGGVGQFAVQLARNLGAHVVATASSGNIEAVRALGADEVIDYTTVPFEDAAGEVDVVFDTAGGERLRRSRAVLRPDGRLVSIAAEPPGGGIYFVVEPNGAQLRELARLADEGVVGPAIDATFPLEEARAAFERSLAGSRRGKIVLDVAT
jgi:NADPH:quinone reductase-like Zn-dependent oxidoreductase